MCESDLLNKLLSTFKQSLKEDPLPPVQVEHLPVLDLFARTQPPRSQSITDKSGERAAFIESLKTMTLSCKTEATSASTDTSSSQSTALASSQPTSIAACSQSPILISSSSIVMDVDDEPITVDGDGPIAVDDDGPIAVDVDDSLIVVQPMSPVHSQALPTQQPGPLKRGRHRAVAGDDTDPEIILCVGNNRYKALTDLEHSQGALLTDELRDTYANRGGYAKFMKKSQMEATFNQQKCLGKRVIDRKQPRHDDVTDAATACDYCVKNGRLCVRIVQHNHVYKVALFPHPRREGIAEEDARFWMS